MVPQTSAGRCPILLVEDRREDAALALHALAQGGYQGGAHVATDGDAALTYLFGPDGPANRNALRLILLDLKLPRVSGIEVLRRLKGDPEVAAIPVVILTSSGEPRDRDACYALGANSYLVKPVDFEAFSRLLEQAVRYWLALNAPPPNASASTGDPNWDPR